MAECNDNENCAAEKETNITSQLEQELLKCETDNRKRCFQLLNRLDLIKKLDHQIYKKQIAVVRGNAKEAEHDSNQTTAQNRVDEMIPNFEYKIQEKEEKGKEEVAQQEGEEKGKEEVAQQEGEEKGKEEVSQQEEEEKGKEEVSQQEGEEKGKEEVAQQEGEEKGKEEVAQQEKEEKDKEEVAQQEGEETGKEVTHQEKEEKDIEEVMYEEEVKDKEEMTHEEAEQIQRSCFGENGAPSLECVNAEGGSFGGCKSKIPDNGCDLERMNPGRSDNYDTRRVTTDDFKRKMMHFEKLIQKDILITEQEISKRRRLLKK